ncbi:MFS transporter [Streptomyces sp. NPDC014986]|uniref:MFS transporter n=1 Tax=Streptomyces sp. NPDC014986 TaxID=3364934 RepID=UPI0036FADA53
MSAVPPEPFPPPAPIAAEPVATLTTAPPESKDAGGDDRPRVNGRYILLLVLAQFGLYAAIVAPMGYSLSVRVDQLAPDNEEILGFVVGSGSLALVLSGPVLGVLSDRTRSRLGRRRPWLPFTVAVGLLGFVCVALAPSVPVLVLGWVVVQLGFGSALALLSSSMADCLPESQRGKVAGLAGVAQMAASIIGVAIASTLTSSNLLLFLVPAGLGAVGALLFSLLVTERDSRDLAFDDSVTAKLMLSKYVFPVRRYPDFAWNWLGRFVFMFGLTLATTFTTFFFADKLDKSVTDIGGLVATVGAVGLVATMGGAGVSGFLSDKLRNRRGFVFGAGILFGLGALTMAVAPDLTVLLVGSFLTNLGLGVFSAVDQALVLDVLPERDTEAGRYNAINQFSTTVPQAAAPFAAPLVLALGGGDNYPLLYIVSGAFALVGGLIILARVKSVR